MADNFQSIQSGRGLLKDDYNEETPVSDALRRRTKSLSDKVKLEDYEGEKK